jgi:hypothetical protein
VINIAGNRLKYHQIHAWVLKRSVRHFFQTSAERRLNQPLSGKAQEVQHFIKTVISINVPAIASEMFFTYYNLIHHNRSGGPGSIPDTTRKKK